MSNPASNTELRDATPETGVPAAREPRGARRKRETRLRLLSAALRLMAEKGMEGVAINEITEAADVGLGSFYNHFESKEAIHAALSDWVFEEFADNLDRLTSELTDPAEVVAVSVRHTLLRAQREPVWGRFLIREGLSARALNRGLGPRLLRDIQKGIACKRFSADDPFMSVLTVGGAVLAAAAVELHVSSPGTPPGDASVLAGFTEDRFAERAAASLLQTLGLARNEAVDVANRPLPAPLATG
ncbi:TetR/AcrR family transcriptional regulator [Paraburkholderia tagetis]|uniref:TetR/AcrR family transcriptional regulator n=1 Tax=Paraburkholderia tagetis TaxID=2913261 RepID=A0A9X1RIL7_9BURK|nr:TetR/AcrR family transcriptional regulator [Paraburkholderia tagetis]MCG5073156.1 TetR/AcrR family transcriptional regulator [Paraburkholderia tagetis]